MRTGFLTLATVAALLAGAARAEAGLTIAADASGERGYITAIVRATPDLTAATIGEGQGDDASVIATVGFQPDPERPGALIAAHRIRWRCDRVERYLWVAARRPDGIVETWWVEVRTPSCANRMIVAAPDRARRGQRIRVEVRDTWGRGLAGGTLCVQPPGRSRRCSHVRLRAGQPVRAARPRVYRRGRWQVRLRTPYQRLEETVAVGVPPRRSEAGGGPTVLMTGDSMMQSVDALMGDRLLRRANVVSDVRIGAALSNPRWNWPRIAREQVAEHRPHATAVFLGTNEGYALRKPSGAEVECCGGAWVAAYARRARGVMRTYVQAGAGRVLWFAVPASRYAERDEINAAVNRGLLRAARGLPEVAIVRADEVFTPGGVFRDTMVYRGRRLRVREPDGYHLSIAGAGIAVDLLVARLRAFGLL